MYSGAANQKSNAQACTVEPISKYKEKADCFSKMFGEATKKHDTTCSDAKVPPSLGTVTAWKHLALLRSFHALPCPAFLFLFGSTMRGCRRPFKLSLSDSRAASVGNSRESCSERPVYLQVQLALEHRDSQSLHFFRLARILFKIK